MPSSWLDFHPLAAIATTPRALHQLLPLCQTTEATLWIPPVLEDHLPKPDPTPTLELMANCDPLLSPAGLSYQVYSGSLQDCLTQLWPRQRGLVFCLAIGAVVRLIAPLLRDKASDPAVVVIDAAGTFTISVCGGHQGGADRLTQLIATQLGITPVITGAAASLGWVGIDVLGTPFGWRRGTGDWTGVSAAIARQQTVDVMQDAGSSLWQHHLPQTHSFQFNAYPGERDLEQSSAAVMVQETARDEEAKARVWISATDHACSVHSYYDHQGLKDHPIPQVQWHPRVLWIGIGCERGSSRRLIETSIQQVLHAHRLAQGAIAGIATIDLKANESGLVELCQAKAWPLRCFAAESLKQIPVPTPSAIVETEVGTPSVAEAAAILATQPLSSNVSTSMEDQDIRLPSAKVYLSTLRVHKQIMRLEGEPGAVTVAIAQAAQEYTGRQGRLYLVGIGPGALEQITPAAQTAIVSADAIIGYALYVDLIRPLVWPGQIVEALPITQERQRAERAIDLADWGLTVAVISSGDSGIYGMAGLVLECLSDLGWDGKVPIVQVFPGITAMQAAAARVGAPLMHDFCAISLSNLLTPWAVIETRLIAAAQADFVVSLYNPKSKTRVEQIERVQQIFLQYRQPEIPVALVRSVYRNDETIVLTTLQEFVDQEINMVTTIVIGNQSTYRHQDWFITPRGYMTK